MTHGYWAFHSSGWRIWGSLYYLVGNGIRYIEHMHVGIHFRLPRTLYIVAFGDLGFVVDNLPDHNRCDSRILITLHYLIIDHSCFFTWARVSFYSRRYTPRLGRSTSPA